MPIDKKALEAAQAFLNTKLDKVHFTVDLNTHSLVTGNFDISNCEAYILAHSHDIDEEIRNLASGANFKGLKNYVQFIPTFPDTNIETQKTTVYAQINDEQAIHLLAMRKYMDDLNISFAQAFQKCAPADQVSDLAAKVAGLQAENANLKGVLRDTLLILDQLQTDHNDLKQQFAALSAEFAKQQKLVEVQQQQDPKGRLGSATGGAPVYRDSPIASKQLSQAPQAPPSNSIRPATAP